MISRWIVKEPQGARKGCIIALSGRGASLGMLDEFCHYMEVPQTLVISAEPNELCWYPQPNGANDQALAIKGLELAVDALGKYIAKVQRAFRLRRNKIVLLGFSAGAVMALQMAIRSDKPFAAAISLCGAILEPHKVPEAKNTTPILLRHAADDTCFSWEERYLPMKEALSDQGYDLYVSERNRGGHTVDMEDVEVVSNFVRDILRY